MPSPAGEAVQMLPTSVPRFWYERAGAAYNLAFEQPPAALDMREFVVYNPAGHAVLTSHDSDLLLFQGDDLERRRGFPSSPREARLRD